MYTLEGELTAGSYSRVAREYYDSRLHPTCGAFDIATRTLIFQTLERFNFDQEFLACDVGAGRSILAEYIAQNRKAFRRLCLIDECAEMLAWSRTDLAAELHVNTANSISHIGTFDLIVSSLGDPYNTEDFWDSASKALNYTGQILFTTPSDTWANRFRSSVQGEREDAAFFVLSDGSKVYVPSYIRSISAQRTLLEKAGLKILSIEEFTAAQLPRTPPKLKDLSSDVPVVTLYRIGRSQSTT